MQPGYVNQSAEWDDELLRSSDFQLISITLDATSLSQPDVSAGGVTKLPKGLLLTLNATDLADGVYEPLSTVIIEGVNPDPDPPNTAAKQGMKDVVILAETIVDASLGDQSVKAYWAGTFDYGKLKWNNNSGVGAVGLTQAQQEIILGRIKIVDTVFQV